MAFRKGTGGADTVGKFSKQRKAAIAGTATGAALGATGVGLHSAILGTRAGKPPSSRPQAGRGTIQRFAREAGMGKPIVKLTTGVPVQPGVSPAQSRELKRDIERTRRAEIARRLAPRPTLPDRAEIARRLATLPDRADIITHQLERQMRERGVPEQGRDSTSRRFRASFTPGTSITGISETPDQLRIRHAIAREAGARAATPEAIQARLASRPPSPPIAVPPNSPVNPPGTPATRPVAPLPAVPRPSGFRRLLMAGGRAAPPVGVALTGIEAIDRARSGRTGLGDISVNTGRLNAANPLGDLALRGLDVTGQAAATGLANVGTRLGQSLHPTLALRERQLAQAGARADALTRANQLRAAGATPTQVLFSLSPFQRDELLRRESL